MRLMDLTRIFRNGRICQKKPVTQLLITLYLIQNNKTDFNSHLHIPLKEYFHVYDCYVTPLLTQNLTLTSISKKSVVSAEFLKNSGKM